MASLAAPPIARGRRQSKQFIDQHVNSILRHITVATSHRFLRESSDKAGQMTLFFRHWLGGLEIVERLPVAELGGPCPCMVW